MMADQWEEATTKLIELTEQGVIHWSIDARLPERRNETFERTGRDVRVEGPVHVAEVNGKRLAVYEIRTLDLDEDGRVRGCLGTNVVIEFINPDLETEWSWPSPMNRYELLESIRFQQSNAKGFLMELLKN